MAKIKVYEQFDVNGEWHDFLFEGFKTYKAAIKFVDKVCSYGCDLGYFFIMKDQDNKRYNVRANMIIDVETFRKKYSSLIKTEDK